MTDRLAQAAITIAILVLAAVIFVGGLGFLAIAAYSGLAQIMSAAAACAVVGAGCIVIAFMLFLVARAVAKPKARPAQRPDAAGSEAEDAGLESIARLGARLGPSVRRHWKASAGGAFAAGLVLGISPRARHRLAELLREFL